MAKVEYMQWNGEEHRVSFYCPGCGELHALPVDGPKRWGWNGSVDSPTLTPSILMRATENLTDDEADRIMRGEKIEKAKVVCHSFVTNGRIQFLNDCTHKLAGQTVELPEIES